MAVTSLYLLHNELINKTSRIKQSLDPYEIDGLGFVNEYPPYEPSGYHHYNWSRASRRNEFTFEFVTCYKKSETGCWFVELKVVH
jgi:hypothetical protein